MKNILIFIISFFIIIPSVKSYCSDDEIIRLSKIANNVTTSYMFNKETQLFEITFSNITKELVIMDNKNNKIYNEDTELTLKNLESGNYSFNISFKNAHCGWDNFIVKNINLPYYNKYHNAKECNGIEEYSYCQKWLKNEISYEIFEKKTTEYRKQLVKEVVEEEKKESLSDKIFSVIGNIYVKYYYIILPLIITLLCIAIYFKDKSDDIL